MKKLRLERSIRDFQRESKLLPGGVSSNARLWRAQFCPNYAPCTIFIKRANGPNIWDVDGNKYIDYRLGFGPVILGHSHPDVVKAIHAREQDGSVYAFDNEIELSVSDKIIKAVPCAEMVRYSVTGTECTMHATRLARAFTGREKIMKFEGHYHGSHDYLLYSTSHMPVRGLERPHPMSLGIPKMIKKLIEVAEFNDFEDVEKRVKANRDKLAAIILEPMMGNGGAIPPAPGFLQFLRELCDKYGILLIFDEVKTGFRLAYGGAQELYNVTPDLATFAKSVSNGYPLSVITGREEIMSMFGPGASKVTHGGTYASNPISMIAADATLDILKKSSTYKTIDANGRRLMEGIGDILIDNGITNTVLGEPAMFNFTFADLRGPVRYRDFRLTSDQARFSSFQYELMKEGVMIDWDMEECVYMSLSHGKKEVDKTLEAFEAVAEKTPLPISKR